MAKQAVKLVFDRRKRVEATGKGNVEFIIQLSRLAVKKIIVDSMTPEEWESYKNAPFLKKEMENYQKIALSLSRFFMCIQRQHGKDIASQGL